MRAKNTGGRVRGVDELKIGRKWGGTSFSACVMREAGGKTSPQKRRQNKGVSDDAIIIRINQKE